jgi:glycosyltransferase involved in cell wall biosynthesis
MAREREQPRGLAPDPAASYATPGGVLLKAGDPVITYVARNLEPYRGFHVFMRALQQIQQVYPHCHAVVVGADGVSYGARPKDAPNWRQKMLREVAVDPARTHFVGRLPRQDYLRVLQLSAAHVYLSYPFVLSWSLLEAMAVGCLVVGSATAPVREVIQDGLNGRLVDFFDVPALARTVLGALGAPGLQQPLREQARLDAQRYGRKAGLAGYDRLIGVPGGSEAGLRHALALPAD